MPMWLVGWWVATSQCPLQGWAQRTQGPWAKDAYGCQWPGGPQTLPPQRLVLHSLNILRASGLNRLPTSCPAVSG